MAIAKAAKPATPDKAGYKALTWVVVGKVVNLPTIGDTHNDITIDLLSDGRVQHVTGSADGGANEVTIASDPSDAGQTALLAVNGLNTQSSFRIVDPAPSSEVVYFGGLVSSLKDTQRDTSSYKGKTFTLMVNTPILRTTA